MPADKWGIPFFYASSTRNPFHYQQSNTPENDKFLGGKDDLNFGSGEVFTMHISGPTSFYVLRDPGFDDSIGGCGMDFSDSEERGYTNKSNDLRDVEYKCVMKIENGDGDNTLSISGPTGHHTDKNCCQGFSYMFNISYTDNPPKMRFRKEMWHVSYHTHSSGEFTHPKVNFKLEGHGYFGLGYCRYNKKDGRGPGKDSVILEGWFNPNPEADIKNWFMVKRIEDKGGWGDDGDDCGGAKDQVGTWGGEHFRIKSNDSDSDWSIKHLSIREIDPSKSFDDSPEPSQPPASTVRKIYYAATIAQTGNYDRTTTMGEEIVESLTDPDPFHKYGPKSWHNPEGAGHPEIGDLCDAYPDQTYGDGLKVHQYWSNNDNNCVAPHISETDLGGSTVLENPNNGPVLKNAKIYLVFWGNDWVTRGSTPTMAGYIDKIQNRLLGSDVEFFTKLSQYGQIEAPTWGGTVTNTAFPIPSGNIQKYVDTEAFLSDTFNRGILAMPDEGNQNIYFVILPVGKTLVSETGTIINGFHNVYKTNITVTPPSGGGGGGTTTTSTITGTFRFNQDINTLRSSPCAGAGSGSTPTEPGGGTPEETGSAMFYQVNVTSHATELSNTSTFQNRTRGGEQCSNSSSPMKNKVLKQLDVWLRKVGSPPATPHVFAKIWSSGGSARYVSGTEIDPSTLTTSFVKKTFSFGGNTLAINTGDVVGVNYDTSSTTDYVEFAYDDKQITNCTYMNWENGVWEPKATTRDFTCQMWD